MTASGNAQATASVIERISKASALAALREEIAAIQDLVIGTQRSLSELRDNQEEVRTALTTVLEKVEHSVANQTVVTTAQLRAAASEAATELAKSDPQKISALRRLMNNGVTTSLIASTIFEGVKAVWPLIEHLLK